MESLPQSQIKKLPRLKPRGGLSVMRSAIRALLLRELQTRFGQYRLGYVWVLLEPLLTIGFKLLIFGSLMQRVLSGISYEIFLVNGILPFFMFRSGVMQSLRALLHKDLKCKAPLIEPNLRRNLGKWST